MYNCQHCGEDYDLDFHTNCPNCDYSAYEDCDKCAACAQEREAAEDREFDEKVALAYI